MGAARLRRRGRAPLLRRRPWPLRSRGPLRGRAARGGALKLRVLSVGKDRSGLFQPAVDEYAGRLKHYAKLELLELPARSKPEEGEVILGKRGKSEWLIALDEHGELLDSIALSQLVGKAQQQAKDLLFVVGGDDGLDAPVIQAAHKVVSLSKMTLPHRLARVVLMEQLYRAFTILRGEPYHRA